MSRCARDSKLKSCKNGLTILTYFTTKMNRYSTRPTKGLEKHEMLRMDVSLYIHTYLLFKSLVLCIDMRCSHSLDGFLKLWFLLGSATSFYIFTQQKL